MVEIPVRRAGGIRQAPAPAPQPNLGQAPTQATGAFTELGQQLQELGNRLFEQKVQEQISQAEVQAQQELTRLETEALQSPDFRQAPESFREQARQRINNIAEQVNPTARDRVRRNLFRQAATQTAQLRRRAVDLSREATEASINNELRSLSEGFAASPTPQGRQVLEDQINQTAQRLVEAGIATEPEAEARARETRAIAQAARVTKLVNDKDPDAALTALENSPDITPDQAFTLNNRIDSARREVDRELDDMIGEVRRNVAQTGRLPKVLSNGVRFEDLEQKAEGTKFAQDIKSIRANVEAIRGHQAKSLPAQRRALVDLEQRAAEDRRLRRRFELLKNVTATQRKGFEQDPYTTGTDVGIINAQQAIPVQQALQGDSAAMAGALRQRQQARQTLVEHTGMNVPLLREGEKEVLKQVIETAPAQQTAQVLAGMGRGLGVSSARRMAEDIAEKDELTGMATLLAPDAPEVATRILQARGAAGTDVKLPASDADTTFDDVVGGALGQDGEFRAAARSASEALYKQLVLERGRSTDTFHGDLFEQATRMVTFGRRSNEGTIVGGPVEVNGRKTLPPRPGVPAEDVREAFEALAGEGSNDLVRVHGNAVPARSTPDGDFEQVTTDAFAEAQPRYIGDGKYAFQLPSDNGFIHAIDPDTGDPTGQPFIFDMRQALESGDIQPGRRREGTVDIFGIEFDLQGQAPGAEGGGETAAGGPGPGGRAGAPGEPQQPGAGGPAGPAGGAVDQGVTQSSPGGGPAAAGPGGFFNAPDAPQKTRDNIPPKPTERPNRDPQAVQVPRPRRAPAVKQLQALAPSIQVDDGGRVRLPEDVVNAEAPRPENAARAIRNHNPLNLAEYGINWNGETGTDQSNLTDRMPGNGFEVFRNPVMGWRAGLQDLLASQLDDGIRTVRGLVQKHSATDQQSYVEFVADRLGVSPSDRVDLTNPNTLVEMGAAMTEFENGSNPYDKSTIAMGAALALSAKGET